MVNWQVTATTIHCDAVDDEVTLLVYKDWSVKCTGYPKYAKASGRLKEKGRQLKRNPECDGPECQRAVRYREKLKSEETETTTKPSDKQLSL